MSRTRFFAIAVILLFAAGLLACSSSQAAAPAPAATPTHTPSPTAEPTPTSTPAHLDAWFDDAFSLDQFPENQPIIIHFNQPVRAHNKPLFISPDVNGVVDWNDAYTTLVFFPDGAGFKRGTTYTLTLNKNLVSKSGQALAQTVRWQLQIVGASAAVSPAIPSGEAATPVPIPPKVTARWPIIGAQLERRPEIRLTFSREMDLDSVARALTVTPAVEYTLRLEGKTLIIDVTRTLGVGRSYRFTLAQTASATDGMQMAADYHWTYQTSALLRRTTWPSDADRNAPITFYFNYPIDTISFSQVMQIEPPTLGAFTWDSSSKSATFTPAVPPLPDTVLTFTFGSPLLSASGEELPPPDPVTFTTPPPIVFWAPKGGDVNPAATVRITFDRPMDEQVTLDAFQIMPETPGALVWDETTLVFTPDAGALAERTAYTITLAETIRGADGAELLSDAFTWTFSTGEYRTVASFGDDGANAQVLDADGRRAVQFVVRQSGPLTLGFDLYPMTLRQFTARYADSFASNVSWEPKAVLSVEGLPLAHSWQQEYDGSEGDGKYSNIGETLIPADIPPGLYILNLTSGLVNDQLFLILTHDTIMLKMGGDELTAWVIDINGEARPGVRVRVYAENGSLLREGTTDAEGIFRTAVTNNPAPVLVVAGEGDNVTVAGLDGAWHSGGYGGSGRSFSAHIYTDRPIYRPGQTVYFKAIVRNDQDALLNLPAPGISVTVRIRDARNNIVQTTQLSTNEYGSIHGKFKLAEGAMLGDYAVEISLHDENQRQTFKVQDYRKPDLEVTLTPDAESYLEGDTITVQADTRYFLGEPVPNAELTIQQFLRPPAYYDWWTGRYVEREDWVQHWDQEPITARADENGLYTFTLPAELDSYYYYENDWGSSLRRTTWGIEVSADDGSNQVVSGFAVVHVYSAVEKISLDTGGYFKTPGDPFPLEAEVVDLDGQPVAGRALTLELLRWSKSSREYSDVIQSASLATGPDGRAQLDFTPEEAGYYRLRVAGADALGNPISYQTGLYVFSDASRWDNNSGCASCLDVTVDRSAYAPGDTATVIIESSFSGPALVTLERGTVREEIPVQLTAPMTTLDIPIRRDYVPNIFITVNAWEALDTTPPDDYYYESLADSRLRIASAEALVPADDKALIVTITPDKQTYGPREEAVFTVQVANHNGIPIQAEVSLALVDEAIYSLSEDLSGPILDSFYDARPQAVGTHDSLALRRYLDYGGGRGGGGGDGFLPGGPRSDFPDTAAWFPVLETNEDGIVTVTLTLPDNLTTWRLTAKAATAKTTKVGEGTAEFITTQEIVVRPILPRTLTSGDAVMLSAMVHNFSDQPREIEVSLTMEPEGNILLHVTTPTFFTVTLEPGEQRMVGWTGLAQASGDVSVTVTAAATEGGDGDAVQMALPIQPLAVPDVTTTVGNFGHDFATEILWPTEALGISTLQIELSRSIAGSLLGGLEYLTGFPYGCVEQTMSKALPNAVIGRAAYQLGVNDPTLQMELPGMINAGLQRLYGFQHNDGGWGWWHDDETHDYQTAWVLFGLAATADAGHEVDYSVMMRGAEWLAENLAEMDIRTQAFALYSLAVAGYGDLPATQALYAASLTELDTFSRAALALALYELGETAQAQEVIALLADTATVRDEMVSWEGEDYDGYYYEKTMASPVRSTALALSAFVQIAPGHELEPGMVRWLMAQRTHHGWGTTNETSFTILALTDHLLASEYATAETQYVVEINGVQVASGRLGPGEPTALLEIPASQMADGANELVITQAGSARLYYVISSRLYLAQREIDAAGSIGITRTYYDFETNEPVTAFQPGQLVKVVLTVDMPAEASYMLVEDQLPGGLEALNESLNNTSHVASAYEREPETFRWQEYGYNYKEVRANRVTFFITEMDKGSHTFTYLARATYGGSFVAMPAEAYAMYDLDTWGRSASGVLSVGVAAE